MGNFCTASPSFEQSQAKSARFARKNATKTFSRPPAAGRDRLKHAAQAAEE
jgi:hypothetical protein